ncbi:MAG: hypothetical protein ACXADY_13875 [Candidatus Hodarchaeales archaeon]|jgi:hypothetical protein
MNRQKKTKLQLSFFAFFLIIAFANFAPTLFQISEIEIKSDSESSLPAIPIYQLYLDAKYAWDKLQLRKDIYGPIKTDFFYSTEVLSNENSSIINNLGFLLVYYSMFKMTNDSNYLDSARDLFSKIIELQTNKVTINNSDYNMIANYDWANDILVDDSINKIGYYAPIAMEDSSYLPFFEEFTSTSHALFWSPNNLIYPSRNKDGTISGTNCHLTWGSSISRAITQLLWMAELTGNSTYKQWADDTIESVWGYRSNSFLLPRSINPLTGGINDKSVSHYDMAGWLCAIELAYLLNDRSNTAGTGTYTYFDIINKTAQGIANHMWNPSLPQRWGYKTQYDTTGTSVSIPEMNAVYVDYAMILAYEITKNEEFLNKAIIDFENEFMGSDPIIPNGVLMSNSLIIHSPNTYQNQCQFTGSSNVMVARTANLIFQYTRNEDFLQKAKYHYNQLTTTHKFAKGYTHMLNSKTLQPYSNYNGNPAMVFDFAPSLALLALPCSFIPSESVSIDWGYGLTTTMPDGYGLPGVFTGVSIDIEAKRLTLNSVSSESDGTIYICFAENATIQSVKLDGENPYSSFSGNTLFCEEGTHSYTITFKEFSTPSSTSSSGTETSTSSSDTQTNQSTQVSFGSIKIGIMIYLIYTIKKKKYSGNNRKDSRKHL